MKKLSTIVQSHESIGNVAVIVTASYRKINKDGIPVVVSTKYVQVLNEAGSIYYVNGWGRITTLPDGVEVN